MLWRYLFVPHFLPLNKLLLLAPNILLVTMEMCNISFFFLHYINIFGVISWNDILVYLSVNLSHGFRVNNTLLQIWRSTGSMNTQMLIIWVWIGTKLWVVLNFDWAWLTALLVAYLFFTDILYYVWYIKLSLISGSLCLIVNDLDLLLTALCFFFCIPTAKKSLCNGGEYCPPFYGENSAGVLQAWQPTDDSAGR
jgi:hypothetical protein